MDEEEVALRSQILLQMSEHQLMPFQRFRTMPDCAMGLQIALDCSFNCQMLTFLW
jgi:hypothetical protein